MEEVSTLQYVWSMDINRAFSSDYSIYHFIRLIRFITRNNMCNFGKLRFQNRLFLESCVYRAKHVNIHFCVNVELIRL